MNILHEVHNVVFMVQIRGASDMDLPHIRPDSYPADTGYLVEYPAECWTLGQILINKITYNIYVIPINNE